MKKLIKAAVTLIVIFSYSFTLNANDVVGFCDESQELCIKIPKSVVAKFSNSLFAQIIYHGYPAKILSYENQVFHIIELVDALMLSNILTWMNTGDLTVFLCKPNQGHVNQEQYGPGIELMLHWGILKWHTDYLKIPELWDAISPLTEEKSQESRG
jgi:hypothetical protein